MPQVQQNPPPAFAQQAVPPVFAQSGAAPQFVYSTDKVHGASPYAEVPTAHYSGSNQIPAARSGWWHRLSRTFKILIVVLIVAILAGLGAGLGVGLSHKKSSGSTSTGSSSNLSVQQVFTTCSKTSACSSDSSGMSTLISSQPL
ncbi:hypothetical protein EHS25_009994 [Saitozyma podzolica]|uniref:Uncharacterized protein n=1 Tax=Saitozyma podzolica TaxID=1890683 RepID=A0A427YIB5_9TREE|nr:hypothetical protein EHS25_009994 [Saitozyma podzolica]